MIGGQTGIVGHINIGNQVKIQAQSGVNSSVSDHEVLYGSPAISATISEEVMYISAISLK
jgi:UDP-3-O-[3-hydroxymyristoyl] glucosamine N-acyltransferase